MSSSCNGASEIDFSSCLGSSSEVSFEGRVCVDHGSVIEIRNLRYSAVRGVPVVVPPVTPPGSSGGGGGGPVVPRNVTNQSLVDRIIGSIEGVLTGGQANETPATDGSGSSTGAHKTSVVIFYTIFIGTSVLIIGAAAFFIMKFWKNRKKNVTTASIIKDFRSKM